MSNESILRGIRAKVRELEKQKQELDKEVESLHISIRVFERDDAQQENDADKDTYYNTLTNAMYEILSEEGKPMHRADILVHVQARGIHVGGSNEIATVGSYLSRDPRFTNVGRSTWDLRERVSVPKPNYTNGVLEQTEFI